MRGKPEYRVRARHHARELERALPIVIGFACGLAEELPATQKSTMQFKWKGWRWIVRATKIAGGYDGVQIKPYGRGSAVRIHHARLEGDDEEIIRALAEARRVLDRIVGGAVVNELLR